MDAAARAARLLEGKDEREAAAAAAAALERAAAAAKQQAEDHAAAMSRARRVLVECPGCGEVLELMKLPRHQREDCENRKVRALLRFATTNRMGTMIGNRIGNIERDRRERRRRRRRR